MIVPATTVVLRAVFLALTPVERWNAARRFNADFLTERWFILIGLLALIILIVMFFWDSFSRAKRERKADDRSFAERAEERGLSQREYQILLAVANKAGLKRSQSIFTMATAFDRGAAKMIEEDFGDHQTSEESKQLKIELSFLREKLGFRKRRPLSTGSPIRRSKKLSSRQIPIGKKLHMTRRKARDSGIVEATVVKNIDIELSVKLAMPVQISFGETWCARYYSGASLWEFDTTVISYNGDILALNHSDNVRFINRRRFLRVPVKRQAFVAHFPFTKPIADSSNNKTEQAVENQNLAKTSILTGKWGAPEFVPAVVTELAGPGLRIDSPLKVDVGDRVLVVFSLDGEEGQNSVEAHQGGKAVALKVVEDLGEVRRAKSEQDESSIAVELIGLSDSDIDELIRATNAASLKAGASDKGPHSAKRSQNGSPNNIPTSADAKERVPEPSVSQGN